MTSPARVSRGSFPATAGRAVPAYVVLVVSLACALGLPSAASAAQDKPGTNTRVTTSPGSAWTPKQPAASQPEAVPSASFPFHQAPGRPAEFEEASLLPLGVGLAGLAALSVLIVARGRNKSDDD